MRSASVARGDLTTRARIRDAAVELFGALGFDRVTVRQVAAAAGVSPGLVIHHFGSKQGLRDACDGAVLAKLAEAIDELGHQGPAVAVAHMARSQEYLPAMRYIDRALVDGGPAAAQIFARIVQDTEHWLADSVATGTVRPTADEHARAKFLVSVSLGLQILMPYLTSSEEPEQQQRDLLDLVAGPVIELYTHGLFTGTEYLDAMRKELQQ